MYQESLFKRDGISCVRRGCFLHSLVDLHQTCEAMADGGRHEVHRTDYMKLMHVHQTGGANLTYQEISVGTVK